MMPINSSISLFLVPDELEAEHVGFTGRFGVYDGVYYSDGELQKKIWDRTLAKTELSS